MKKPSLLLLIAMIAAALSFSTSAFAGKSSAPKRTPIPPKHTTISSVSADSITVSEGGSASKTYKISPSTTIEYNGQSAKVTDLQAGMRVSVTAGVDPSVASRISANAAPKEPAKSPTPGKK